MSQRRINAICWTVFVGVVVVGLVLWLVYASQPHLSAVDVRPGTMVGSDWGHLNAAGKWSVIDIWPTTRDTCKARHDLLASNMDAFYAQAGNAQVTIENALTLVLARAGCLVDIH